MPKKYSAKKPFNDYKLNADEAGELLGYNPRYLKQLACVEKVPGLKVGNRWWFSQTELSQWFKKKTAEHQKKMAKR